MSKSRIFLWILLAVIAGVGVQSFIPVPLLFLFIAAIASTTILGTGAIRQKRGLWIPALLCLAFLCGAIRFATADFGQSDFSRLYDKSIVIQGVIDEDPDRAGLNQRIVAAITAINGSGTEKSFRVLVTTRRFPEYALGDEIKLRGMMESPRRDTAFDEVSYLKRRGITATLFYPQVERIAQGKGNWLVLRLARLKYAFENNIEDILPEPHAAFLKGLIVGDRASLPPEILEQFRATGTSHMVALSGYNITIIASAIQRVFLALTIPFVLSFWLASGLIILFIIMTGAGASIVRAGIMGLLLLVAEKEGRIYRMTPALAVAAAAMVMQNPYVLRFDAGFQLSFGATLGLVYISPYVERWIDTISRRVRRDKTARALSERGEKETPLAKKILIETLAAQIAALPLLMFLFGRVSLVSPIVNVLVLMVTPYAMGIGFVAALIAFISPAAGRVAGGVAWIILEYQLRTVAFFATIPFASIQIGAGAAIVFCLAWVMFFVVKKKKYETKEPRR